MNRRNRIIIMFALLLILPGTTVAQHRKARPRAGHPDARLEELINSGRYNAALLLAKRTLVVRRKAMGPNHPDVAITLANIGLVHQLKGDFAQAEFHYKFSISMLEKAPEQNELILLGPLESLARLYYDSGNYTKAQPPFERKLATLEKRSDPNDLVVAQVLDGLGLAYYDDGDYARARPLLERALKIREERLEPDDPRVAISSNNLAELYRDSGDLTAAEPLYEHAIEILEKISETDHSFTKTLALALENLAHLQEMKGDPEQAEYSYGRILKSLLETVGPNDPAIASSFHREANKHQNAGNYKHAEPIHQHALSIRETVFGRNHPLVASSLLQLARLYLDKGDYVQAMRLIRRAIRIYEKTPGPDSLELATSLHSLGTLYEMKRDYASAESLYDRSLKLRENKLGLEHAKVADSVATLALLYMFKDDLVRAEPLFERALAIFKKTRGPEHSEVASVLNNVALLHQKKADYKRAEKLFNEALEIWKKVHGQEHAAVATALNNLGELYREMGDYPQALLRLQQALTMREKVLNSKHPHFAQSVNNVAALYEMNGDYAQAESMHKDALKIREAVLSPTHPDIGQSLMNLGVLYLRMGDYTRAKKPLERAAAILEKAYGPTSSALATALNNLAQVYSMNGDSRAETLHRRGLDMFIKTYGSEHPIVATALDSLGVFLGTKRDYPRSESLLQQGLEMRKRTLNPNHPDILVSIHNLSWLYRARGDLTKSMQMMDRGIEIEEAHLDMVLAIGSENQKQLYLNQISGWTHHSVSFHVLSLPQDRQAARLALTAILRRKGRALDAMTDQVGLLRRHATPETQILLDRWRAALSQLATFEISTGRQLTPEAYRAKVVQLTAEVERLAGEVSRSSAAFRIQMAPVMLDVVRQAIPIGAALVEIFSYRPIVGGAKHAGESRYVAYVLRRNDVAPSWVELGEAAPIDEAVDRWRQALANPPLRKKGEQISDVTLQQRMNSHEAEVKELARALDERLMRPVRKLLGPQTRNILLSPDGALNLMPFGALVNEDGEYLIEKYSITYLTSGRDLLSSRTQSEPLKAPVIIANPSYDFTLSNHHGLFTGPTSPPQATRRSRDFALKTYSSLPGTAEEATALNRLFPDSLVLTQEKATEFNLKQITHPRILHIATHGFFLPAQLSQKSGLAQQKGIGNLLGEEPLPSDSENPLLRSGLLFAGVNQRQSGTGEDGVLTALEVTGMDLWGTKLVVLSACETALGEVHDGAGVYGLRRALILAGSETQVMSLWKVSDTGTTDLMTAYYTRLQKGEGRTEALRQVQLVMLKGGLISTTTMQSGQRETKDMKGDAPKYYRHPYYWAAFIQSGDWRNLEGEI